MALSILQVDCTSTHYSQQNFTSVERKKLKLGVLGDILWNCGKMA